MTLPINFSTCHVFANYLTLKGTALSGTVSFTAAPLFLQDPDTQTIMPNTPIVGTLNNGALDITIPATDDSDINPNGWTYLVTEALIDGGRTYSRTYSISAPSNGQINLADVAPVSNNLGDPIVRGPIGLKGDKGDTGTTGEIVIADNNDGTATFDPAGTTVDNGNGTATVN